MPAGSALVGTANPEALRFLGWHLLSKSGVAIHTLGAIIRSAVLRRVSRASLSWSEWCSRPARAREISGEIRDRFRQTCWLPGRADNDAVLFTEIKATKELTVISVLKCAPFPVFVADSAFGRPAVCFLGLLTCKEARLEDNWLLVHLVA